MNVNWNTPTVYLVDGRQVFISNNYTNLNYNIIKIAEYIGKKIEKKTKNEYKKRLRNNKKKVSFNMDKTQVLTTYSNEEYDRTPIDSVVYLRTLQRINQEDWNNIFIDLNKYKTQEMIVHKDSINNVRIHS